MCRLKCSLCHGCGSSRLWLYFFLQTALLSFIAIWPNFGAAWSIYHAGSNRTYGIWEYPPFPFGGDLLVTIVLQTLITFLILSLVVSFDRNRGPDYCLFGIKLTTQKLPSSCCAPLWRWIRPLVYNDFKAGCKEILFGLGRVLIQVFIWLLLLGIPTIIITCVQYLPNSKHRFTGVHLAIGKGIFGFLVAFLQTPVFVWFALIEDAKQETV